jgi:NTP pyrophosphatase (non-canonical NTP hydrolase)
MHVTVEYSPEETARAAAGLNAKVAEVRAMCDAKGFSAEHSRIWEMLALIHTEISEAADAYKKGLPLEAVGEELVDAIIRIFHLLSALELDTDAIFAAKMAKNWRRPHKFNTVRGG